MLYLNILPELAHHEYKIDYATGDFSVKVTDYAQQDILSNFAIIRTYNSRTGKWKFNLKDNSPKLTLKTLREIFFIYKDDNLIAVKDEIGRTTRYEYENNRLSRVNYPDGSYVKYSYGIYNRLILCVARGGKIVFQNVYDEFGRLMKTSDDSGTREFIYEDKNMQTIELGAEKTVYHWNRRKLIDKIIFSDGTYESFIYDDKRRLNYKVDRNGYEYFWRYSGDFLTRIIFPNGAIKKFEYDANANIVKMIDSSGYEEDYTYSSKNLMIAKKTRLNVKAWRHETWERDIEGRVLKHDVNGQVTAYSYDGESPAPSLIQTPCGYKFSCFYDKAFRILSLRTQAGEFFFAHTPMNDMIFSQQNIFEPIISVEDNLEKFDVEILDIGGRRIEGRRKVEDKYHLTRWKYDLNDNCIERRDWQNLQTLQSATGRVKVIKYEYDAQNRLIKKIEGGTTTKYNYDCLNKLVSKISKTI